MKLSPKETYLVFAGLVTSQQDSSGNFYEDGSTKTTNRSKNSTHVPPILVEGDIATDREEVRSVLYTDQLLMKMFLYNDHK